MYLQSIKSVKQNAAKSVNRSTERKADIKGLVVFIVHSSMGCPLTQLIQSATGVKHQSWLYTRYSRPGPLLNTKRSYTI